MQEPNLPMSAGLTLTVSGLNYGVGEHTMTAALVDSFRDTYTHLLCDSASWTTQTTVMCNAEPSYSGTISSQLADRFGQSMILTVGSVVGTFFQAITFDAPSVTAGGRNTPFSGGASITVMGLNFGELEHTHSAALSTALCVTSSWLSATAVTCAPGPMREVDPPLDVTAWLTVGSVAGTSVGVFSFDAAVVSAVRQNAPHSGYASVTVFGLDFGVGEHTVTAALEQGGEGTLGVCVTSSWSSATSVACLSNPIGDLFKAAGLSVNTVSGTGLAVFSFDTALVSNLRLNSPHSGYA